MKDIMPYHIFTEPVPVTVPSIYNHTKIETKITSIQKPLPQQQPQQEEQEREQEQEQELKLLPDGTWKRKQQWRKPATIKKKKRYRFIRLWQCSNEVYTSRI